MEDGLLIAPAPYSAPAAYYFPLTSRISNMEVFKGPSAILYGPNSIGGAINMLTPDYAKKSSGQLKLSTGQTNHSFVSHSGTKGNSAWYVQFANMNGDLIRQTEKKEEDLNKNDVLLKLKNKFNNNKSYIEAKFSYGNEESGETYLGSSTLDALNRPTSRYLVSQDDALEWDRIGSSLKLHHKQSKNLKMSSTAYFSEMDRVWKKFNGLKNDPDFKKNLLLGDSSTIALINGQRSNQSLTDNFLIGNNDRNYQSYGLDNTFITSFDTGELYHELTANIRFHFDSVQRLHTEEEAYLENGNIQYFNDTLITNKDNSDQARALTIALQDEVSLGDLTLKAGLRFEKINLKRTEDNQLIESEYDIFSPGVSFNYSVNENIVALAGINRGVTIVGPGQSASIEPESSVNYEAGLRFKNKKTSVESIAFYSDYSNIKGTCSFSNGCEDSRVDDEFNGGKARIYGLENQISHTFKKDKMSFPVSLNHTFTVATFTGNFQSDNPEWGIGQIQNGDPLPYVPQNTVSLSTGFIYGKFSVFNNINWKSKIADQSVTKDRRILPSYGTVDLALKSHHIKNTEIFLNVSNLLDHSYITSLRPFGARAGAPRIIEAGMVRSF